MSTKKMTAGRSLLDAKLAKSALWDAVRKLSPRTQWANPVMFVVYLGAILSSLLWWQSLMEPGSENSGFVLAIALWLWFTVLFANFAEALAEGRGKARADSLKAGSQGLMAQRRKRDGSFESVAATALRKDDVVLIPIRMGVGLRLGVNAGYMKFSRKQNWLPF